MEHTSPLPTLPLIATLFKRELYYDVLWFFRWFEAFSPLADCTHLPTML